MTKLLDADWLREYNYFIYYSLYCVQGCRNWGAGGAAASVALYQEGQGVAKVPFQFKGLPWRNSEFSEIVSAISEL
jgi:hypothetical protein